MSLDNESNSEQILKLKELILTAQNAIRIIEMGEMRPMTEAETKRYPRPCDCDFIIGNFAVKNLNRGFGRSPASRHDD